MSVFWAGFAMGFVSTLYIFSVLGAALLKRVEGVDPEDEG